MDLTTDLFERLGPEAAAGLIALLDAERRGWRTDVVDLMTERLDHRLSLASERFERRLSEEVSNLRVALVKELHDARSATLMWAFAFWVGQFAAFAGLLVFMQRTLGR